MNDNVKQHYNRRLDLILSRYITPKRYGEFAPVLKEIFQRRAYEYEFTEKEMKLQVSNFVDNVKKIEFASEDEDELEYDEGSYSHNSETIYINRDYLINLEKEGISRTEIVEELFETLTHEVYHAIVDIEDDTGLAHWDDVTEQYSGNALDEIFTEVSADRTSFSRTAEDAERYRSRTTGYSKITFAVNLLAAGLGVTEKKLLKSGIQNRHELMKLFTSRFPNENTAQFAKKELFDKFEASLDIVYNALYQSDDIAYEVNSQMMSSALTSLYANIYNLAILQTSYNMEEPTDEYISSVHYRFLKMERIMKDSLDDFKSGGYINDEQIQYVNYMTSILRSTMANKVLELKGITTPQVDPVLTVTSATQDMLYNGIVIREDFDNGKQWDNEEVINRIFSIYDKNVPRIQQYEDTLEMPTVMVEDLQFVDTDVTPVVTDEMTQENKTGIFDKIKTNISAFFIRLKNSRQAKLNPPQEASTDKSEYYASLATSFSKKYYVPQDKLRPMKEVSKDTKPRAQIDYEKE